MSRKTSCASGATCLQLAFLGAEGTGKASLIHQVLGNGYIEDRKPDVDDIKNKTLAIPGMNNVVIMDTSDLHNFPPMKRVTIQRASIFVLVFAVDNEKTFLEMESYYKDIVEIKKGSNDYVNNKIPIVVVGNKSEVDSSLKINRDKIIDKVVNEWDCKYIEASARNGSNINELTDTIIQEIRISYGIKNINKKKNSLSMKFKAMFV